MSSQEILQEAMVQYDGTIITVSHNRHFVNGFINKVLEIKDGHATLFEGNIDDYLYKVKSLQEKEAAIRIEEDEKSLVDQPVKQKGKAVRQEQARIRQEKSKNLNPLKKEVALIEEAISGLESRKKELEQLMADPELYQDQDKFAGCSKEYKGIERKLELHYDKWAEVQARIEAVESEYEDIL
jgi:ATP-binding cassette subfamily F protein 3